MAERLLAHDGPPLPVFSRLSRHASAVLVGDFFDAPEAIAAALAPMAEAGVRGHLLQVVDPSEETLPWSGRVEFQAVAGPQRLLFGKTETIRAAYAEKLRLHRAAIADLCTRLGWTFTVHRTDQPPARILTLLHGLVGGDHSRAFAAGGGR
jgi:uncharacterized protein (DUF58 family)